MQALKNTLSGDLTLLMGVYNGARHLPGQLHSIAAQDHPHWQLVCSDDGSTDNSAAILSTFAEDHGGRVRQVTGPRTGFSANYMQLMRDLPVDTGPVGFCDQDDVWLPDKLSRGVAALDLQTTTPQLYCARRWNWYPYADKRQASAPPGSACSFRNALIENIAFGNTILLNPAAARLARAAARRTSDVFAHDWWLYLLITGAGGEVVFDAGDPVLLYRQHETNALGCGRGVAAQIRRKHHVLQGVFANRITANLDAMNRVRDLLTPEATDTLDRFVQARGLAMGSRIAGLRRVAPYRQSRWGTLGFWGAAGLGRI